MKQIDRVLKAMTRIMFRLASIDDPSAAGEQVFRKLSDEGYSKDEIRGAVTMIGKVVESISLDLAEQSPLGSLVSHRPLTSEERLRLSEEAFEVFRFWRENSMMLPEEAEDILHDVITAGPGDVEKEDLIRIARDSVRQGSSLALFLSGDMRSSH